MITRALVVMFGMVMRRGVKGLFTVAGQLVADVVRTDVVGTGWAAAWPPVASHEDDVAMTTATSTAPVRFTGSSRNC
jgi:hypothetical protein